MKEESPLYAAVLIGGKSQRMGRPKHLICTEAETWLERTVRILEPLVERIVLVGTGDLPPSCVSLYRLPDITAAEGPLAGVVAAMRYAPAADWLVIACDMPAITVDSIHWLLQSRASSAWGVVPRLDAAKPFYEPLFALYKAAALTLFEALLRQGETKIGCIARAPEIATPLVPPALHNAWKNINTPKDLEIFIRDSL